MRNNRRKSWIHFSFFMTFCLSLSFLFACSAPEKTEPDKEEEPVAQSTDTPTRSVNDLKNETIEKDALIYLDQNDQSGMTSENTLQINPVYARNFSARTLTETMSAADVVFEGKVESVNYVVAPGQGFWTQALVSVEESIKGPLVRDDTVLVFKNQTFLPMDSYLESLSEGNKETIMENIASLEAEEGQTFEYVQAVDLNDVMWEPGQRVILALEASCVTDLDGSWQAVEGIGGELFTIDGENWMQPSAANSILNQKWDVRNDYSSLVDGTMVSSYTIEQIKEACEGKAPDGEMPADENAEQENPEPEDPENGDLDEPEEDPANPPAFDEEWQDQDWQTGNYEWTV